MAELLDAWHDQHAVGWMRRTSDGAARVTVFFALLLGLCQVDALASLGAPRADVSRCAEQLAATLFPEEGPS